MPKQAQVGTVDCKRICMQLVEEEGVIVQGHAFYNPVQKFNRTMTIRIINAYKEHFGKDSLSILECMSATGIRAIRYCREIKGSRRIVMNDLSARACAEIVANCQANGIEAKVNEEVDNGECSVEVCNEDCRVLMLQRKHKYDVIDIDPFGSCALYIESALESIAPGGLLCVTSTDLKALCDSPPEACFKKYGACSISNTYSHEVAIRIILSYISRTAAKLKRTIRPLISLYMDFFIRVFVVVDPVEQKYNSGLEGSSLFFLCQCLNHLEIPSLRQEGKAYRHAKANLPEACPLCARKPSLYGPLWKAPLHDPDFIQLVLAPIDEATIQTKTGGVKEMAFTSAQIDRRIHGMLSMAKEEEEDAPFFYTMSLIATNLKLPMAPLVSIISFLEHNGYTASLSHCRAGAMKTKAPLELVYLALAEYFHIHQPNTYNQALTKALNSTSQTPEVIIFNQILNYQKKSKIIIDFTITQDAKKKTSQKYLKFPDHIGLNWGPGSNKPKQSR
ncbi:tRNA (guanine26-N2/guanine27-N2)-dimethyltransferase [Nematocida homosporus]|uniref:tRNA (guanine26-N2/guanine27-N2)-dimethyltransferase n=1 Tax=Nematocida homosporus TaxID=1912981 RepID=UPI00221EAA85|nr:tRNA (guanine26-N2/guanine27-N2)-dimethyltransferase [Nematocida homosporus]KAI5187188.1 tRNA (guanine26-N2/guanine27-N2)-dimethyltransferase [Nematocida homosporus]